MRPLHGARRLARLATLVGVSATAFSASPPTAADLARCAKITDSADRLACYDALAADQANAKAAPATSTSPAPPPTPFAPAAPTAPAAPAVATAFASDPQNFGFTEAQRSPVASQAAPNAIKARIAKVVDSRWGQSYAVLDNGQTWVFVDSDQDAGLRPEDSITIKRGTLGSFLLITPSHRSYHVKRTQ